MSLREQFEAWLKDNYPGIVDRWVDDPEGETEAMWHAFQAGHAVNADLLEVLVALTDSFECYIADNKPQEEWDEYDHMMLPRWQKARAAIKKARAE